VPGKTGAAVERPAPRTVSAKADDPARRALDLCIVVKSELGVGVGVGGFVNHSGLSV